MENLKTIFFEKRLQLLGCKGLKKDDNKDFRFVQNLTTGESDLQQFMRLMNQLLIAAENFGGEPSSSPIQLATMSKDMDEQLKLAHRAVDVVDCPKRKMCVTMLRCNVDKPESSYAQVRILQESCRVWMFSF